MFIEEITRDLNKRKGWANQYEPIILRRGEKNETQIKVKITNNGVDYPLSGLSAKFCAVLEDKSYVIDSNHVSISGSTVTYTVQDDLTSIDGDILVAYVELSKSGAVLTTDGIPFIVLPNTDISDSEAKKYQSKIDVLMEQLTSLTSEANEVLDKANSALMDAETASEAAKNANTAANNANEATKKADGATKSATDAAKSANDAAKKVTDAMATFRTIVSETTEYATDTQGTTPPSGGWSATTPKDVKGLWVWVRTTTTYNTGNPDIKYQAVYSGLDGTFTGEERVTKLEETVAGINDYTTGINLLRGTRDFKIGTEAYGTTYFADGFSFVNKNLLTFNSGSSCESGYVTITRDTNRGAIISSAVTGINPGEDFTISFDFKVDDTSLLKSYIAIIAEYSSRSTNVTGDRTKYVNLRPVQEFGLNIGSMENDTWYQARYVFTSSDQADPNNPDSFIGLYLNLSGDNGLGLKVSYRNVKIERGSVNHPIWSPSPFDIDSINDITTSVNLIRSTKDFLADTNSFPNNTEGFYDIASLYKRERDDFGFTKVTYNSKESSAKYFYWPVVMDISDSKEYTLFFDVMLNESYSGNLGQFAHRSSSNTNKQVITISTANVCSHMEVGKWYTVVVPITLTSEIEPGDFLSAWFLVASGNISFKKSGLYEGHITLPEWSASPFDIDHINDKTTGINLIRGSRDFVIGTKVDSDSNVRSDGFELTSYTSPSNTTMKLLTDTDGFTYLEGDGTYGYTRSTPFAVTPGGQITVSCKVRTDEAFPSSAVAQVAFRSSANVSVSAPTILLNKATNDSGVFAVNEWLTVTETIAVPANADHAYVVLYTNINSYVAYKQLCVYKGRVNNPIWSASPFDVAQNSELENTYNGYVGSLDTFTHLGTVAYSKNLFWDYRVATLNGAIKLVLPILATENVMLSFKVSIYDYYPNGLIEIYVHGYVFGSSSNWYTPHTGAYIVAQNNYVNNNLPIKFGVSDGYAAMEIGTDETVWRYAQVAVSDIRYDHRTPGTLITPEVMANDWKCGLGKNTAVNNTNASGYVADRSIEITDIVKTIEKPYILSALDARLSSLETAWNNANSNSITAWYKPHPTTHTTGDFNDFTSPGSYACYTPEMQHAPSDTYPYCILDVYTAEKFCRQVYMPQTYGRPWLSRCCSNINVAEPSWTDWEILFTPAGISQQ